MKLLCLIIMISMAISCNRTDRTREEILQDNFQGIAAYCNPLSTEYYESCVRNSKRFFKICDNGKLKGYGKLSFPTCSNSEGGLIDWDTTNRDPIDFDCINTEMINEKTLIDSDLPISDSYMCGVYCVNFEDCYYTYFVVDSMYFEAVEMFPELGFYISSNQRDYLKD